MVAACSAATTGSSVNLTNPTSEAVSTNPTTVTTETSLDRGDLAEWEPVAVHLGEHELTVALADEESERQRGLQGVVDFGDFDGMLFAWEEEVTTGFWMKDAKVALDILYFDGEGALVDQTTMQLCTTDPCEIFVADRLFRWALELPAGTFPLPAPTDRLRVP
ncbi:MAG: DUF192 domain-containing protein [Acidimicrobiia bacterium]